MAIFGTMTPAAARQIEAWAATEGIAPDELYVQIDDKPVGPYRMFWVITLTREFNAVTHYLEVLGGIRLAVEQKPSIFLVGATIDYQAQAVNTRAVPFTEVETTTGADRTVQTTTTVFRPHTSWYPVSASQMSVDRPVMPHGFLFIGQNIYPETQVTGW